MKIEYFQSFNNFTWIYMMHSIYASILYIMYIHVKNLSSLNTQILTVESIYIAELSCVKVG